MKKSLKRSLVAILLIFGISFISEISNIKAAGCYKYKVTYQFGTVGDLGDLGNIGELSSSHVKTYTTVKNQFYFSKKTTFDKITNAGYEFNGWKIGSQTIAGTSEWPSSGCLSSATTAVAQWTKTYAILKHGDNQIISNSQFNVTNGSFSVTPGFGVTNYLFKANNKFTVNLAATNNSYELDTFTINGTSYKSNVVNNKYEYTVKSGDISNDIAIVVTFKKKTYNVTTSVSGVGGTISDGDTVEYGNSYTATISPDEGYEIDELKVNGSKVDLTSNTYTISNITIDQTVVVTFKKIKFDLNVIGVENAYINPVGIISGIEYGNSQDIVVFANKGYKIVKIIVTDKDGKVVNTILPPLPSNNTVTIEKIKDNMTVTVEVEKEKYKVVEGANQLVSKGKGLTVRFNGDLELFRKLYINGKLLDQKFYTLESGSTIVNVKDSYLSGLKPGKYTLVAEYANGNKASTQFVIPEDQITNPETSDKVALSFIISLISLAGVASVRLYTKKRFN